MEAISQQKSPELNVSRSQEIRDRIRARNKECFHNAFSGLAHVGTRNVFYVEGWAVNLSSIPIPVEHAWIEDQVHNEIIDPTPVWCDGQGERLYFAGVRYTLKEVVMKVRDPEVTLPLVGINGLTNSAYRSAYLKASRIIYGDQWPQVKEMFGWDKWEEEVE